MATAAELSKLTEVGHLQYEGGRYREALLVCEKIYELDAYRPDNLLMLGGIHFQLRNFSEAIFYLQQCIRIEPSFAEAYSNLGNAIKELGDLPGAVQFYLKAIKLKPRYYDAYNNLALVYTQQGEVAQALQTYQMALVLQPNLVEAHCNLGNLHKAQGNLEGARRSYLEAIRIRPDFAIAWSNLAGVFKEEGQLATAVAYYREAVRLAPHFADAYSNLGNALKEQGNTDEATSCYKAAIAIRPDFAIAHGNLGSCYYDKGMLPEAIKTFKHAVQLKPNFPDCFNNLGNALRDYRGGGGGGASESDSFEEAIHSYRTALRLKPDHPHAYNNLGNALTEKGLVKEAMHCFVTAARLMPKFAAAHSNIGCLLREMGKLPQALAHFHEAVELDPGFADAYSNMGTAYRTLGRTDDAVKCFVAAIQLQPSFADAYANLAACYVDSGELSVAIECYKRSLVHSPDFAAAEAGLCWAQLLQCEGWDSLATRAEALVDLTQHELSSGNVPAAAAAATEGIATAGGAAGERPSDEDVGGGGGGGEAAQALEEEARRIGLSPRSPTASRGLVGLSGGGGAGGSGGSGIKPSQLVLPLPSVQPFQAAAYGPSLGFDRALQQDIARRYAARATANATALSDHLGPQAFKHRARKPGRRLHVGFVASELGDHPVGHLLRSVLTCVTRSKVQLTCYALSPHDLSQERQAIERACERFVDLSGLSDEDAARTIHGDAVHVLVNTNGFSDGARNEIFALKPAPVQVHLPFGYCGTMGASEFMDYVVGDASLVPRDVGEFEFVDEKVAYMPHSFCVGGHRDTCRFMLDVNDPLMPTRADYGLPEDKFVFCNFSQLRKITPALLDVWCAILKRVPNSLLWLLRFPGPGAEENVRAEARKRGIKGDQLVFSDTCPREEHVRRGKLAEVFLDTPFSGNAHTTAMDCLWSGTPVVTVKGDTMACRVGESLLGAVELSELCCADMSEYEETAVVLAVDDNRYMRLRTHLEMDREVLPLFDNKRWVKNLEAAFEMMWERHERGLEPDHLTVPDARGPGPQSFGMSANPN